MSAAPTLQYQLTADVRQFEAGLQRAQQMMGSVANDVDRGSSRAQRSLKDMGREAVNAQGSFGKLQIGVAALAGAIGGLVATLATKLLSSIVGAIKGMFDFARQAGVAAKGLRDLSDATGISVAGLRRFEQIALAQGENIDQIVKAVRNLGNNLLDIQKASDPAAIALRTLGLEMTALQGMSPEARFEAVANALGQVDDVALRNRLSMDLLGVAYERVAFTIDASTGKIAELTDEQQANIAATEANAQAFADLDDAMIRVGTGADTMAKNVVGALAPMFTWIIDSIANVIEWFNKMWAAAGRMNAIGGAINGLRSGQTPQDSGLLMDAMRAQAEVRNDMLRDMPAPTTTGRQEQADRIKAATDNVIALNYAIRALSEEEHRAQTVSTEAANARIQNGAEQVRQWQAISREAETAGQRSTRAAGAARTHRDELAQAAQRLNDLYDPMQKLNREVELFNQLFERGLISAEVRDRAIAASTENARARLAELNGTLQSGGSIFDELKGKTQGWMNSLIDGLIDGKFNAADFFKNIAKDFAKMALNMMMNPIWDFMKNQLGGGGKAMGGGGKASIAGGAGKAAMGGVGKAASGGPRSGLTMVGERGPELVNFGKNGAYVHRADETRRLIATNSNGGNTNVFNTTVTVPPGTSPEDGEAIAKAIDAAIELKVLKAVHGNRRPRGMQG